MHRGIYSLFHLILALFFVICIIELHNNVGTRSKYKKVYPELEIQPSISKSSKTVLIRYDEGDVTTVDRSINLIDDFLEGGRIKRYI